MSRTVKGGKSPQQAARRKNQRYHQEDIQRKRDFRELQKGGPKKKPSGPQKRT